MRPDHHLPSRALGLLSVVTSVFLLAACGASPSPSAVTTPVSQTEALQAMASFWNGREQALIASNASVLDSLYTGPGLDLAKVDFASKRNDWPGKYPRPFSSGPLNVYLPTATSSPLWFIGDLQAFEVNKDGASLHFSKDHGYFLFAKVDGAWKVYAPLGVSLLSFPLPTLNLFGSPPPLTLPAPAAAATYLMDPSRVAFAYISHLNALASGQASNQPFSSTVPPLLAAPPYGGASVQMHFGAYPKSLGFSFVDPHGNAIVFFTITNSVSVKMPAKACLYKAGYAYSTSSLPNLIPPGRYGGYTSTGIYLVAATVPQKTTDPAVGRQVVTFSVAGDVVTATSQPAAAGSSCYIPI